jgi:uncharacterized protein (DUF362 family)
MMQLPPQPSHDASSGSSVRAGGGARADRAMDPERVRLVIAGQPAAARAASRPATTYEPHAVSQLVQGLLGQRRRDVPPGESEDDIPLSGMIEPGQTVTLKPNWVLHKNLSGAGLDCLVTHAAVVAAVLDAVLKARPGRVVVGDAPVQVCDLQELLSRCGYDQLMKRYASAGEEIAWRDFRRSRLSNPDGIWQRHADLRGVDDYVVFDLGEHSLLEPIADGADLFRVTMYNPEEMSRRHRRGRHQYWVAKEVIEADVIVNLPKLKTHKKTCITGALKNVVGINGDKDCLPHHRRGGSSLGGDCYQGRSRLKSAAEYLIDAANQRRGIPALLFRKASGALRRLAPFTGADTNLEGNWYGNDTIWRTCLDLNRIVLYGRPDGTLADQPQRRVVSVTDALIGGQGEGPLAPTPHSSGILTFATNAVAADYVHAHLMGFDWRRIPLLREAFCLSRFPLIGCRPDQIEIEVDGHSFSQPWPSWNLRRFAPPKGWLGHCER